MKKIEVDIGRMKELAKEHTAMEIAEILNISRDVCYARLREFNITPANRKDAYEALQHVNTADYTLAELARICGVSKSAIWNKLNRDNLPYVGRLGADVKERRNNGYIPVRDKMTEIRLKSKLVEKETKARKQGMYYADMQKAETLEMYGRVKI